MSQQINNLKIHYNNPIVNRGLWIVAITCLLLLLSNQIYSFYLNKSFSKEYIEAQFSPLKQKYGIEFVYEISENYFSPHKETILPAGPPRGSKITPIRHRDLLRYPELLRKALSKYPLAVIKQHLNAIYFAGRIIDGKFLIGGTYDPFRKIVYLTNDSNQKSMYSIYAFHHEFSSLILKSRSLLLNPWLDNNPEGFVYRYDTEKDLSEIYNSSSLYGTEEDYQKGFMNSYGQTNFENDFNEYSAMIFTYPQKFKQIMDHHPRVRGKFLVWLKFYQQIDPIFTEAYFFGQDSN